jgi:hypothetical protein
MTGNRKTIPLAEEGRDGVVPSPLAWNELVREVNRLGKLSGGAGISITSNPDGITITNLASRAIGVIVQFTSVITSQGGRYNGKTITQPISNPSGDLALTDFGSVASSENIEIWNAAEIDTSFHFINFGDVGQQVYWVPVISSNATTGKPIGMVTVQPGPMFPVALTQTGGSNGSQTTQATWTYTANNLTGDTLGTVLSPQWPRQQNGELNAATAGVGYYDVTGTFVLSIAYEYAPTGPCP